MDDLFGDLPPPSISSAAGGGVSSLFDDLPPESTNSNGSRALGKRKSESSAEEPPSIKIPKLGIFACSIGWGLGMRPRGLCGSAHSRWPNNDLQVRDGNQEILAHFTVHFQLKGYLGERKGEREDMQDAHVVIDNLTPQFASLPNNTSRVAYYGVFDGHAGPKASQFAADNLHKKIVAMFPKGEIQNLDREVKKCLVDAYKKTDEEFLQKASAASPSWKDGSTAVTIVVLDNTIYSANLGDSKAVLCRRSKEGKLTFVPLTKEHTPSIFEERKRIEKAGGMVREGRVMGIVEVSRSIGDGRFKHCGVISTPDVLRCQLTENDLFILIACDGLWKVFSAERAGKFILSVLEDESVELPEEDSTETNFETRKPTSLRAVRYEEACNRLAVEAVKKGCTDNVTVMLVDITQHSDSSNTSS